MPQSKKNMNKNWEELERAIKGIFKKDEYYSREIKTKFSRWAGSRNNNDEIGIFLIGIDNCYNKKMDWQWEIFLNKDGTWKIS